MNFHYSTAPARILGWGLKFFSKPDRSAHFQIDCMRPHNQITKLVRCLLRCLPRGIPFRLRQRGRAHAAFLAAELLKQEYKINWRVRLAFIFQATWAGVTQQLISIQIEWWLNLISDTLRAASALSSPIVLSSCFARQISFNWST